MKSPCFVLLLACHATSVSAATFTIQRLDLDEGNVVALLEASSQWHVDAMRSIIEARYPGDFDARRWELIERHARSTPIARIHYEYRQGNVVAVRTYHAIGGEPLSRVAANALGGPTPADTPSLPGSPSAPDWPEDGGTEPLFSDDELAAAEAVDDVHYAAIDESEVRAPFRPSERTVMKPYWHEGSYHALDPEQKALRALEDDILDGTVPRGGSVRGFLSSTVCATCRRPIQRFAEAYELDVEFTDMVPSVPSNTSRELVDSGLARMRGRKLVDAETGRALGAFDALEGARDAQVRQALSPVAANRSAQGMPSQLRTFRLGPPRPRRITEHSSSSESATETSERPIDPEC